MNSRNPANGADNDNDRQAQILGALAEYAVDDQDPVLEEEPFDPEQTYCDLGPLLEKYDEEEEIEEDDVQFICEVKVNDNVVEVQEENDGDMTDDEDGTDVEVLHKIDNFIDLTNGK